MKPPIYMFEDMLLNDDFEVIMLMSKKVQQEMKPRFTLLTKYEARTFIMKAMKAYYESGYDKSAARNKLCRGPSRSSEDALKRRASQD